MSRKRFEWYLSCSSSRVRTGGILLALLVALLVCACCGVTPLPTSPSSTIPAASTPVAIPPGVGQQSLVGACSRSGRIAGEVTADNQVTIAFSPAFVPGGCRNIVGGERASGSRSNASIVFSLAYRATCEPALGGGAPW